MKTTGFTRFFNQDKNKGRPNSKSNREIKKTRIRTQRVWNKNLTRFYYKEETKTKHDYDKKMYPKSVLNILKVMWWMSMLWGSFLKMFTHDL